MKASDWIIAAAEIETLEQLFRRAVKIEIEKGESLTQVNFTFKEYCFTALIFDAISKSLKDERSLYSIYSIREGYTHLTISIKN